MEKNLKSDKDYNDQYDRIMISILKDKATRLIIKENNPPKKILGELEYSMEKRRLFDDRENSISEWRDRDRKMDKMIEQFPPLSNLKCVKCDQRMEPIIAIFREENTKLLYAYDCVSGSCKSRRSFYTDGTEYITKKKHCPECADMLELKDEVKKNIRVLTDFCPTCSYSTSLELDLIRHNNEEVTKEDRLKYCRLTKLEKHIIEDLERLDQLSEMVEKSEGEKGIVKKYKLDQIEHLKIFDLEKKLKIVVELDKFEKFQLDKPIITHYVSVEFSALDSSERSEQESKTALRKIIRSTLLHTNWRLMTTDISYRLGYLTGKLRAYENQEDLIKIGKEILDKK